MGCTNKAMGAGYPATVHARSNLPKFAKNKIKPKVCFLDFFRSIKINFHAVKIFNTANQLKMINQKQAISRQIMQIPKLVSNPLTNHSNLEAEQPAVLPKSTPPRIQCNDCYSICNLTKNMKFHTI